MAQEQSLPYQDTQLYRLRHSTAHVMAQAVMQRFPGARLAISPPVEDGFYYAFELLRPLTTDDFELLEQRRREIVAAAHRFEKGVLSADQARRIFADQPYKLELIDGLEAGGVDEYGQPLETQPEISIYTHDTFVDLGRGLADSRSASGSG